MGKAVTSGRSVSGSSSTTDQDVPNRLGRKSTQKGVLPWSREKIVFISGLTLLIISLSLALFVPNPTPFQSLVFRVTLALAAAGFGALIPGLISARASRYIKATGATALFVIIYWFNPAKLVHEGTASSNSVFTSTPAKDNSIIKSKPREEQQSGPFAPQTRSQRTSAQRNPLPKSGILKVPIQADDRFVDSISQSNLQTEQTQNDFGGDSGLSADIGTGFRKEFHGKVVDEKGNPISGAGVSCDLFGASQTKTNGDGMFTCPLSPDQEYIQIEIRAAGFSPYPYHQDFRLAHEALAERTILLDQVHPIQP